MRTYYLIEKCEVLDVVKARDIAEAQEAFRHKTKEGMVIAHVLSEACLKQVDWRVVE